MDKETFLEKLGQTAKFYGKDWENFNGSSLRIPSKWRGMCSLTAVCGMETSHRLPTRMWRDAGESLGMDPGLVEEVNLAAEMWPNYNKDLREQLKEVINLSGVPEWPTALRGNPEDI